MSENETAPEGEGIAFATGGKEPDPWWIDDTQIVGLGIRLDILRACNVVCETPSPEHALRFLNDIYAWVLSGERVPNLGGRGKLTPIDGGKNEGK